VASAIGWDKLARSVAEAERLARPDKTDLPALAARAWPGFCQRSRRRIVVSEAGGYIHPFEG